MTDLQRMYDERIAKIRSFSEYDYDDMDEDGLCEAVGFSLGDLSIVVIPTIADGLVSIEAIGYSAGGETSRTQLTVRSTP